jgi:hypothetical protein
MESLTAQWLKELRSTPRFVVADNNAYSPSAYCCLGVVAQMTLPKPVEEPADDEGHLISFPKYLIDKMMDALESDDLETRRTVFEEVQEFFEPLDQDEAD